MNLAIDLAGDLVPSTLRDPTPTFPPPPAVPRLRAPRSSSRPEVLARAVAWDCTATLESAPLPVMPPRSSRPVPRVEVVTVQSWTGWIQQRVTELVAEMGW